MYGLLLTKLISEAILAAMSIDLGSQFMKIGLVKPGVPMEIVLNKESRRKTQTMVALRNGERFFGDVAAQMVSYQNVEIKRLCKRVLRRSSSRLARSPSSRIFWASNSRIRS